MVLPYINMNPPQVYTCSPSWTPLPPPSLYHPSGSSQCTSPKHPVSCIKHQYSIILLSYKDNTMIIRHFIVVQSLSYVWLFATPWTAACQVSLSFAISWSLFKFMSIELVMPPNHLILCHPLLSLSLIIPSIRVFSIEMVLHIRWPKYWRFSFSFSFSSSNDYSELTSFRIAWFDLLAVWGNSQEPSPAQQFKSISSSAPWVFYCPALTSVHDYWKDHSLDYIEFAG